MTSLRRVVTTSSSQRLPKQAMTSSGPSCIPQMPKSATSFPLARSVIWRPSVERNSRCEEIIQTLFFNFLSFLVLSEEHYEPLEEGGCIRADSLTNYYMCVQATVYMEGGKLSVTFPNYHHTSEISGGKLVEVNTLTLAFSTEYLAWWQQLLYSAPHRDH